MKFDLLEFWLTVIKKFNIGKELMIVEIFNYETSIPINYKTNFYRIHIRLPYTTKNRLCYLINMELNEVWITVFMINNFKEVFNCNILQIMGIGL